MRRLLIIAAAVLAFGGVTVAIAQEGENGGPTADCAEATKAGGDFGKCVSEAASAYGKCVAEAAKEEGGKPTAACEDLKPGKGHNGNGNQNGNGVTDVETSSHNGEHATNPTTGLTKPPEQAGRDFGQQVAANARGDHGPPENANPTEGLVKPPEQAGRDFGGQVSETKGDHGPPGG
jgi:hypothetical protein